jgi:hypothetical protein
MPNTPKFHKPLSTVITVPDPSNMSVSAHAEQGGTFEWRTDSHQYPEFEVRFQGPNPSNEQKDLVLQGSDLQPVVMRLNTVGNYQYMIRHKNNTTGNQKDTGPYPGNVNPCRGCPAWVPGPGGN